MTTHLERDLLRAHQTFERLVLDRLANIEARLSEIEERLAVVAEQSQGKRKNERK